MLTFRTIELLHFLEVAIARMCKNATKEGRCEAATVYIPLERLGRVTKLIDSVRLVVVRL